MHLYFIGETDQSKLLETIQVHVKPGHSMRPPHKHSEEEILLVLEGDGEFLVDGKPIACLAEAMLYAAPGTIYIDQGGFKVPMRHSSGRAGQPGKPLKSVVAYWQLTSTTIRS